MLLIKVTNTGYVAPAEVAARAFLTHTPVSGDDLELKAQGGMWIHSGPAHSDGVVSGHNFTKFSNG